MTARLELDVRLPLDDFTLAVAATVRGAAIGVFGPSGAGKSSLLEAIAGLRPDVRGRIALDDAVWLTSDGRGVLAAARGIGYVPQDGLLFPHWSVRRNLVAGRRRAARIRRALPLDEIVALLDLAPLLDRRPTTLSGGERQRVALGRALASGPRLLLLDEPLTGLDLPRRRALLPLLQRVRDAGVAPLVLVSHDPVEMQALCDVMLVLDRGQLVAQGDPAATLADPSVVPLMASRGVDLLLPGRLDAASDDDPRGTRTVRLDGCAARVHVPARTAETLADDAPVFVGLSSSEILVMRPPSPSSPPVVLSARNRLAAHIAAIEPFGDRALLRCALDASAAAPSSSAPQLTVDVTAGVPEAMALAVGGAVALVFKAAACRLLPREVVR
ncbi:MAG: ATP-binding cassette domain-containing protein [Acidobacteriota bacterium]